MRSNKTFTKIWSAVLAYALASTPVMAAWDSTQPASSSALSSAPVRDNFKALEGGVLSANHIANGDLWDWTAGGSAAPDNFTLTGAACTIARTGTGMADTFSFGAGRFAAKITRAGTNCVLTYTPISTTDMADLTRTKGKRWHASMLAKSSTASHVRVTIDDGVGTTSSSYHTGGGSTEFLVVSRTLDAAATKIDVKVEVNTTDTAAYVGGFAALPGEIPPSDWFPRTENARSWIHPRVRVGTGDTIGSVLVQIHSDSTQVGNVGAGEDTLMTYAVKGNTLVNTNDVLKIEAWGRYAGNANTKTIKLKWGATTILNTGATAQNGARWFIRAWVQRTGAATQDVAGELTSTPTAMGGVAGAADVTTAAETLSGSVTLQVTCESGASATDDCIQDGWALFVGRP